MHTFVLKLSYINNDLIHVSSKHVTVFTEGKIRRKSTLKIIKLLECNTQIVNSKNVLILCRMVGAKGSRPGRTGVTMVPRGAIGDLSGALTIPQG